MEFASGFVTAVNEATREMNSARPNAPVVPHIERTRPTYPIRKAIASGLHRIARAIAPAERSPAC
jgi:hypothetical protein